MAQSGRNATCPCGSGKKTKHCCGQRASRHPPSPGAPLHLMDERLVEEMLAFANRRFGRDWITEALEAYLLVDVEFDQVQFQFFMPWAVHHWRIGGRPVREWFLEEQGARLSETERAWLLAQASAVVTLWEVREVRAGEGVAVTDLLSGDSRFVHEVTGSRTLRVWDTALGRVVDQGGISVFCGLYPRTLPPRAAAEVVWEAREILEVQDGPVPREKLSQEGMDLELIHLWMDAVLDLESAPPLMPKLTNTDGDPLLITVDHFTFAPQAREQVLEGLLRVKGAELETEGMPADIVFLKKGNAMHKSWKNTVVGNARVAETSLRLETNSLRRADALRKRVEKACAGLLSYRTREHSDPEALLPARGVSAQPTSGGRREEQDPALLSELRAFKTRHYQDWLDSPLPALGGKTPREAVRTKAGRREVGMLLKEMEHRESGLPEQERADLASLRGELGLME